MLKPKINALRYFEAYRNNSTRDLKKKQLVLSDIDNYRRWTEQANYV